MYTALSTLAPDFPESGLVSGTNPGVLFFFFKGKIQFISPLRSLNRNN